MSRLPPIGIEDFDAYQTRQLRTRRLQQISRLPPIPQYRPPAPATPSGGPPPVAPRFPAAAAPTPEPSAERPAEGWRPTQLTMPEAMSVCGPAAAIAFARRTGRNPTAEEAIDLARQVGYHPSRGMAGPASQKALLDKLGVPARLENGVDWAKVQADVAGGNPVTISTPGHYFVAEAFDPQSGKFDFGTSATDVRGVSRWMTPQELARTKMGAPTASLYLDNPDPATAPSIAVAAPQSPAATSAVLPPIDKSSRQRFMETATPYALQVQAETGLPADIMLGIAVNEGAAAPGTIASNYNNLFGIKATRDWQGKTSPTVGAWEVIGGRNVTQPSTFRAYDDPADSFRDFAKFLEENPRYKGALEQRADPAAFVRGLHQAGYATDPAWTSKVLSIAKEVDTSAAPPPTVTAPPAAAPTPPAAADWYARAQQQIADLEATYGGRVPKPQPMARPSGDWYERATAEIAANAAARPAVPPVTTPRLPPYQPRPQAAAAPEPEPITVSEPELTVEGVSLRDLESYDQPTAVTGPPPGWGEPPPRRPTGDADLGIGLEPAYEPPPPPSMPSPYLTHAEVRGPELYPEAPPPYMPPEPSPLERVGPAIGQFFAPPTPEQLAETEQNVERIRAIQPQGVTAGISRGVRDIVTGIEPIGEFERTHRVLEGGALGGVIPEEGIGLGAVIETVADPWNYLPGGGALRAPVRGVATGAARAAAAPVVREALETIPTPPPAVVREAVEAVPPPGAGTAATEKGLRTAREDLLDALSSAMASKTEEGQVAAFIERVAPDYAGQQTDAERLNALLTGVERASEAVYPPARAPQVAPFSGAEAGVQQLARQLPPPRVAGGAATPPLSIEQLRSDLRTIVNATPDERTAFMERMRGGPEPEGIRRIESVPGPVSTGPARARALNAAQPLPATASEDLAEALADSLRVRGVVPEAIVAQRAPAAVIGGFGGATAAAQEEGEEGDDQRALRIATAIGLGAAAGVLGGPRLAGMLRSGLARNATLAALRGLTDEINLLPPAARGIARNLGDNLRVVDAIAAAEAKAAHTEAQVAGFAAREAAEYARSAFTASRAALGQEARASAVADLLADGQVAARILPGGATRPDWVAGKTVGPTYADHQFSPEAAFILRKLEKADPPNVGDYAIAAWKSALLTNPASRIRDALSSVYSVASAPAEVALQAPIDIALTGGRRLAQRALGRPVTAQRTSYMAEAPALVQGYAAALPTAFRDTMKMLRYGYAARPVRQDVQRAAGEVLPGALNLPGRLIGATDVFFKALSGNGSVYAQAVNTAKREGKKGQAYIDRIADLRATPTQKMLAQSEKDARYRSFQSESKLAEFLSSIKNRPDWIGQGANWVLPFHSTAIALSKWVIERSPLGLLSLGIDVGTGRAGQREVAEGLARVGLGSALLYEGVQLAQSDALTGAAPKSAAERDAWTRQGKQPYSVKIGGEWKSYQGMPFAPLLAAAAVIRDRQREGETDDAQAVWITASLAAARELTNQSWFQSITQLADALEDDTGTRWNTYAESWARSLVPQGLQAMARASDNIVRDPESPIEAALSVTPGLSGMVAPRYDVFGNPVTRPAPQMGLGILRPERPSPVKTDPVEDELARLQLAGYKAEPGFVGKSFKVGPVDVELTREERAQYQQAAGKNAYGMLSVMISNPRWESLSDEQKATAIKGTIENARKQARAQLTPSLRPRAKEQYRQQQAESA